MENSLQMDKNLAWRSLNLPYQADGKIGATKPFTLEENSEIFLVQIWVSNQQWEKNARNCNWLRQPRQFNVVIRIYNCCNYDLYCNMWPEHLNINKKNLSIQISFVPVLGFPRPVFLCKFYKLVSLHSFSH